MIVAAPSSRAIALENWAVEVIAVMPNAPASAPVIAASTLAAWVIPNIRNSGWNVGAVLA